METFFSGDEQIRTGEAVALQVQIAFFLQLICKVSAILIQMQILLLDVLETFVTGDEQIRGEVTSTNRLLSSPAIDPSIHTNANRNSKKYKHKYIRE